MSQTAVRSGEVASPDDAPTGRLPRARRARHRADRLTVADLLAAQASGTAPPVRRVPTTSGVPAPRDADRSALTFTPARPPASPSGLTFTAPRATTTAPPAPTSAPGHRAAPAPAPAHRAAPVPAPAHRAAPAPARRSTPAPAPTPARRAESEPATVLLAPRSNPVRAAAPVAAPAPSPAATPARASWRRADTAVTTLVVLVPAHDEEAGIADTVEGLLAQEMPDGLRISGIVVVADNCTDRTVEIARRYPVEVIETRGNTEKKAGALNEGWRRAARDADLVLTMDADTVLRPGCAAAMAEELQRNTALGAVCARYWAAPGRGLAWRLQRLEYSRYDDLRELRGWRVSVASGAAAMYRREALDEVAVHRSAGPWDGSSLIEDYALTLDLKTAGWTVGAARGAHVLTHPPTSFRELWVQRLRWGRGGMDECLKRGWTRATRKDILSYGLFVLSVFFRLLFVTMLVLMITHAVPFRYALIGLIPLGVMWLERVTSMWRLPGRTGTDVAIVAVLVVEDLYGFFLEFCAVVAAWRCLFARRQGW
ncbi:glycosyltransferase [Actinomycetospora atypica]|uniref:Glycosyltransferase n=1 Tax=Actinomycetospora atypica TaxID=1290095 RepID=A0ABV9YGY3_9PSEU